MSVDITKDLPQEIEKNQFLVLEKREQGKEIILIATPNELHAHKVFKSISHSEKRIAKGEAIYSNFNGLKILVGYEEY